MRDQLLKLKSKAAKSNRWTAVVPLIDVVEHFFFTQVHKTQGPTAIRDAIDVQRIMVIVWLATFPCILWGSWNIGFQALSALPNGVGIPQTDAFHALLLSPIVSYAATNMLHCFYYGLMHFLPIYIVTFAVGIFWEALFAMVRKHDINEGFFVTSVLFALACPPSVPLWQVAIGISFGVVIAKEIFGGTGMNFVNPALAGRAFLFFSYPAAWSGDTAWVAGADALSSATPLSVASQQGVDGVTHLWSFWDVAGGVIPGSIGEGSMIAIAIGAAILLVTKVASWRIMLGVLVGVFSISTLFNVLGGDSSNAMMSIPFHWHIAMGGLAFGMVFMATEPVTAPYVAQAKWAYGISIGVMVVLIRVLNPGFPEGMMLAILFCNLLAPVYDYVAVQSSLKKREKRFEKSLELVKS